MTKKETAQIVFLLKEYYPNSSESSSLENRVQAWHLALQDHSYQEIQAAMLAFITADTKGFMPSVGQLIDKALSMRSNGGMTELEAWGLVSKALRNSTYGAAEEFEKLPPEVKRVVRDPQQLREWAMMEAEEVQTVVASNFQRSFRAAVKQERDYQALPESVKNFMALNAGNVVKEIPQGATGKLGDAEIEAIQRVLMEGET